MQSNESILFLQVRQNILQTAIPNMSKSPFNRIYLFAWYVGVYPLLNTIDKCDEAYQNQFNVTGEQMHELANYLDQAWTNKTEVTFHELEQDFEHQELTDWNREKLIDGCRYLYMCDMYNYKFWHGLLSITTPQSDLHIIKKGFMMNELLMCV